MDYFETQDIQCGRTLTSEQFIELFNDISDDYIAKIETVGDVIIEDSDDGLQVAKLWFNSRYWLFEYERAYSYQELNLMVQLVANMPVFRGGKADD